MNSIVVKTRFAPSPTGLLRLRGIIVGAGADFFTAALEYAAQPDFKAFCTALSAAVGKKGKASFLPLRAASTADSHGPEMQDLASLGWRAAAAVCKG